MEAQTDITTYLEQGKQALAQGKGRDAAIAYAHGAQLEPDNPLVHLGLAEANLALGDNGVVLMACRRTQELAHEGPIYHLAQALFDLLDRRYIPALEQVDAAIQDDPGNAYAHALRAYLLRATNQTYDAGLARARASRLSIGGTFENCFPPLEPLYTNGYQHQPTSFTPPHVTPAPAPTPEPQAEAPFAPRQQQREQFQSWSRTPGQRQMIRANFWLSQRPRFITYVLMGLTLAGFLFYYLIDQVPGAANLLGSGFGRIVLATFIPYSILGLLFNLFSLFFVGSTVEMLYGKWRYVLIYLLAGSIGNLVFYLFFPSFVFLGASNAIFGAFGALGAFFIVNRRALGPVANSMLMQWGFWLLLNLAFAFTGGITLPALLASLAAGLVLGIILIPPMRRTGRRF
ncbi:MAG TPA: rhomboid family intramembrane serine protease [Ktedonobacteraceae bacterium]